MISFRHPPETASRKKKDGPTKPTVGLLLLPSLPDKVLTKEKTRKICIDDKGKTRILTAGPARPPLSPLGPAPPPLLSRGKAQPLSSLFPPPPRGHQIQRPPNLCLPREGWDCGGYHLVLEEEPDRRGSRVLPPAHASDRPLHHLALPHPSFSAEEKVVPQLAFSAVAPPTLAGRGLIGSC